MVITYYGNTFVKIVSGDITIALNPISKKSKYPTTRFGSDIVFITNNNIDCNGTEQVSRNGKELFIIDGPGEYEVQNIFVKGDLLPNTSPLSTVYFFTIDSVRILFLGNAIQLPDKISYGEIDLVFVSIDDDPSQIYKLLTTLSPTMIIPLNYDKKNMDIFLKEGGSEESRPVDKITLRKKDFLTATNENIVILNALV